MPQIKDLTLEFGPDLILDDVSFNINRGEKIGLVGRNGSGKSTLFKLLSGEMPTDEGVISMPKNYTIGYLKQHLAFTKPTVLEEVCQGLREEDIGQEWKAESLLMGLGFNEADQQRPPTDFSGGFQVRLNLAKVLLAEPDLLLLDEPTNYLDIVSIRWLTRFLKQRENEFMLVTHDREFMNDVTTHTMAIHRRKIKKVEGDTEKLFAQIAQEEEVYEKTRVKDEKKRKEVMEFINKFRAQAARATLVQSKIKALERMGKKEELVKVSELGFKFNYQDFQAKHPLRTKNLSFNYPGGRELIKNLTFEVSSNDRICVIGKNGKGKSTLLRLLAGELKPVSGTVDPHPACATGYFGQTNIERLNPYLTVEKELWSVRPDLNYTAIRTTCGVMMFSGDAALKDISVLSGGEKSRVSLGKILLHPANLLLLDEPTNHLDIESCDSMIVALDEFPGAVVIVTHSEMFLHHLANRLIVFGDEGVSVFEGTYQEFLDRVGWEDEPKKQKKEKPAKPSATEHTQAAEAVDAATAGLKAKLKLAALNYELAQKESDTIAMAITALSAVKDGKKMQELQIAHHKQKNEAEKFGAEVAELENKIKLLSGQG